MTYPDIWIKLVISECPARQLASIHKWTFLWSGGTSQHKSCVYIYSFHSPWERIRTSKPVKDLIYSQASHQLLNPRMFV